MHVLLLPSRYPSYSNPLPGIFFKSQAQALAEAGVQVGVVAPIAHSLKSFKGRLIWSKINDTLEERVRLLAHNHISIPWMRKLNAHRWLRMGERMAQVYFQRHGYPDILHAHCALYGGVLASRLASKLRFPYVITEHSSAYLRGLVPTFALPLAQAAFNGASRRLAVSEALVEHLSSQFASLSLSWNYLPNVVDGDFFSLRGSLKVGRNDWSDEKSLTLFTAAILTKNKGMDLLLEAISRIRDTPWKLMIAGGGPELASLKQLTGALRLSERVRFLGMLSQVELRDAFHRSDAFVLPSHYETFGVVLIEALACGIPVIATDCGGPSSIVTRADGILVPPGNSTALAAALSRLAANLDAYDAIDLRQRCLARFGKRFIAQSLIDIYEQVLAPTSPARQEVSA